MILYKPGFMSNSVFTGLFLMVPIILLFTYSAISEPVFFVDGSAGNDLVRAGWVLLFLSPIICLVFVAFFYTSSRILFLFKKLNLLNHELFILLTSVGLSCVLAYDNLIFFILFLLIFSISLSIGTMVWHFLEKKRYNKFQSRTARLR